MNEDQMATNLRLQRRLSGQTQEEVARQLDVTVRTYARWENGESKGFVDQLDRIAKVLGTTADQLLGSPEGGSSDDRLAALETEIRELRALLLDPTRLKAAADALRSSEDA